MAAKPHSDDGIIEIPTLKGLPLVGNTLDVDLERPTQSVAKIAKRPEFQDAMALHLGGQRLIFVNSAALLHEICDESRFRKVIHTGLDKLRPMAGDGLFTAHNDEPNWGVAHRVLMPVFGPLKIREMLPQMQDIASQMCLKWARHGESYDVDVASDCTRLTLDTIALCTMGFRFNSFYDSHSMHPFVDSMLVALHEADVQSNIPAFVDALRVRSHDKFQKHIQAMRDLASGIIARRRAAVPSDTDDDDKNTPPDLLDTMLRGRDPQTGQGMTDESIVNNILTFLIAGHETTSGLLSFVFYYLLQHPEALARARDEVDEVAGTLPLTAAHLSQLPYLTAVLRETLRLQPTAPAFGVTPVRENDVLGGRYRVRAGEVLFGHLLAAQSDPAVYGADAGVFRPERMLEEAFRQLPPGAWKPFGNGMRGCIGRPFAWQEALLVLATVLQHFDLASADPNYVLRVKETLTLKPDGFRMRAKLRHCADPTSLAAALQPGGGATATPAPSVSPNKGSSNDVIATTTAAATAVAPGGKRPLALFYGSNTGTCEVLARRLARDAATKGFLAHPIAPLDAATAQLPTDRPVVILTASYDGQPAGNAAQFVKWLESLNSNHIEQEETIPRLEGVSYAVFGCGHRDWPQTLYRVPKRVDRLLAQAGAQRLAGLGTADSAVSDLVSDLDSWAERRLWPALGTENAAGDGGEKSLIRDMLRVRVARPRRLAMHEDLVEATVTAARGLTRPGAAVRKQHLELALPAPAAAEDGGPGYAAGDHLVVLPTNPPAAVQRALAYFGIPRDAVISAEGGGEQHYHDLLPPKEESITAADLLGAYTELAQPATPKDIRVLAAAATNDETRDALRALAEGGHFAREIRAPRTSVLDLLERFPSEAIALPFGTFLALLPPMRMRTYSISSAPSSQSIQETKKTQLSLTFSVLEENKEKEVEQQQQQPTCPVAAAGSTSPTCKHRFLGVASNYLADLAPGDVVYVGLRKTREAFRLPADLAKTPIVMVAAGTGLAPFRGFLQELARARSSSADQRSVAPATLFFGCRGPEDDLYRDELDAAERAGAVSVVRAYSRAKGSGDNNNIVTGYVQNALESRRDELATLWGTGAKFFVCGSARMAGAVKTVVRGAAAQAVGMAAAEADAEWFAQFEPERYVAEIFA